MEGSMDAHVPSSIQRSLASICFALLVERSFTLTSWPKSFIKSPIKHMRTRWGGNYIIVVQMDAYKHNCCPNCHIHTQSFQHWIASSFVAMALCSLKWNTPTKWKGIAWTCSGRAYLSIIVRYAIAVCQTVTLLYNPKFIYFFTSVYFLCLGCFSTSVVAKWCVWSRFTRTRRRRFHNDEGAFQSLRPLRAEWLVETWFPRARWSRWWRFGATLHSWGGLVVVSPEQPFWPPSWLPLRLWPRSDEW